MKKMINPGTIALLISLTVLIASCGGEETTPDTTVAADEPAIANLNRQIAANPGDASLYAARAELYYREDAFDEAIADLQHALTMDSVNVDYHHLLADVYMDYFQSRMALKTMQRAAALYPERIPTLLKLSEYHLILKQYDESMKTVDQVLRLDPQSAEGYFMLGMNLKETGDTIPAINAFQESVEINPELLDAWINLGQLHASIDGYLAEEFFDNAIELDPLNPYAYHAKADYLRDQDKLTEAIELYRKIAQIDSQYEEAYYNAGLLYMELDSVALAYDQFDIALQVDPLHIRSYFFRGYAAELMGRVEQARSDYRHALRLAPDYELPKEGLQRIGAGEEQTR